MYAAPGIGLAAIQVAQPIRLITMDLAKKEDDGESKPRPRVFINRRSCRRRRSCRLRGRLPVDPGILRGGGAPARVRVRFTISTASCTRKTPRACSPPASKHEIDHLNGVLFVDYLSKLKRDRVLKKFAKAAKRRRSRRSY